VSRLLLWRHARTTWNSERRTQGQLDVDLDEAGVRQAAETAPLLAAREPKLIISSDLGRATRTAQALVDLTGLPIQVDARLRERHFGPWQGLTVAEIQERYPDDYARLGTASPLLDPAIETLEAMAERMVAALRDAAERVGDGGTAVLVTHGSAARVGIAALLGWPRETWHTLGVLGNCRIADLWLRAERDWQLEAYNAD
jgi:glucosyl-3-phosphoglycerate phosphatase